MDGSQHRQSGDPGPWSVVALPDLAPIVIEIGSGAEAEDSITRSLADGVVPPDHRDLLQMLRRLAPSGGRVLDLGAHVGTFALSAAAAGYQVVAVEASPRNAGLLRASAARNGFGGLKVVQAAVSDRPGVLRFNPFGPYGHVATAKTVSTAVVEVPAVTVDGLLAEVGWDGVHFIKMDIEGSEVAAARGMARLLGRRDGPPIYYESNGYTLGLLGRRPRDLKGALERFGYRNYLVEPGRLLPVRRGALQPRTVVDHLALKGSAAGPVGWRMDGPLSREELIRRALATCQASSVQERMYIADALARSAPPIRYRREVREALTRLRRDPHPAVRDAASFRWSWRSRLAG